MLTDPKVFVFFIKAVCNGKHNVCNRNALVSFTGFPFLRTRLQGKNIAVVYRSDSTCTVKLCGENLYCYNPICVL